MRRIALALALCASLGVLAGCKPEDPAPLEAERTQLLGSTVPRDEYWNEVGRKGAALREQRAAQQRSARATAESAQIAAAAADLQTRVTDSRRINAEVVAQIDGLTAQIETLQARHAEMERFLAQSGPPAVGAPAP